MLKGWLGELKTGLKLSISLNSDVYRRYHDVIIPSGNGTTQIDHLIVSPFGVFIVETKNLKGWIYGDAYQETWTQAIYRSKHQFQNPLRQTYRQKKVLSEFFGIDENKIHPVISFVGKCKFKTEMPPNVLKTGVGSYIEGFQDRVITDEELDRFEDLINELKSDSQLTLDEHIQSLKDRHSSTVTCPKCGAALVERETRNGPNAGSRFLGCETYPRCRYSRELPHAEITEEEPGWFVPFVMKITVICLIIVAMYFFSKD
jgi:restriction system protein